MTVGFTRWNIHNEATHPPEKPMTNSISPAPPRTIPATNAIVAPNPRPVKLNSPFFFEASVGCRVVVEELRLFEVPLELTVVAGKMEALDETTRKKSNSGEFK